MRVHYEAGYHVDLPVYRRVVTSTIFGDLVIHYELAASSGWKRSDARDVSKWYEDARAKSADGQQLRRINRVPEEVCAQSPKLERSASSAVSEFPS